MVVDVTRFRTTEDQDSTSHPAVEGERLKCPWTGHNHDLRAADKALRAHMKAQRPCILWFTGLPGAGKSTVLNLVEQRLAERGVHTYALDSDNVRRGLNRDLGFTDFDRVENIRPAGEVARSPGGL